MVIKKDGHIEPFDQEKLKASLMAGNQSLIKDPFTRVCFQKHKSKKKLKKYTVSLLKPKGKQVVDVEYNL